MTAYIADAVFDGGLTALKAAASAIYICKTQQPTNYTEATSTYAVGHYIFGAGNALTGPTGGSPSGRKVSTVPITAGVVDGAGTNSAGWWALVDGSTLYVANSVSTPQNVTYGNTFTLTSADITLRGAS